jgi:hypothetical protein
MRPQSSVELLESKPRFPAKMYLICPVQSRRTTLNPAGLGFPFEAPSKFILRNLGGGQCQEVGLGEKELGCRVVLGGVHCKFNFQFERMRFFGGSHERSS